MVVLEVVVFNMKTVFLVVGETSSGKDTFVHKICEECGYSQLISYATRPRRDGEGETHIFISDEDAKQFVDKMIAYTRIGEYQYFATIPQLYESDFYVIDPNGADYMKFITQYKNINDVRFVTIYINTPVHLRKERALNSRGDKIEVYFHRALDEQEEFTNFKAYAKYDYAISNVDFDKAYKIFKYIVQTELGN